MQRLQCAVLAMRWLQACLCSPGALFCTNASAAATSRGSASSFDAVAARCPLFSCRLRQVELLPAARAYGCIRWKAVTDVLYALRFFCFARVFSSGALGQSLAIAAVTRPKRRGHEWCGRGQRVRRGDGVVANDVVADGAIVNYEDIKLVLCDTLPPRRRVWHARLAAGGFRLFLDRFAKLNHVARCVPGGVVRSAARPNRNCFDTAPLQLSARNSPRALGGSPNRQPILQSIAAPR